MKFLNKLCVIVFMCKNICKENNFFKDKLEEWYGISCRKWSDNC